VFERATEKDGPLTSDCRENRLNATTAMTISSLWDHRGAIAVAIAGLFAIGLFVNWMAWIFKIGRFARASVTPAPGQPLRYVVANFFAEIINDFRHFLALVIVVLFAVALFAAMYPGLLTGNIDTLTDGVQAVAAALGGLIGSIIGYYFGESAASRKDAQTVVRDTSAPVQQAPEQSDSLTDVVPAPEPPTAP
jgi:hypothetical protein